VNASEMLVELTRTFITLSLLGELGEVDRIFTRLGHVCSCQWSTKGKGTRRVYYGLLRSSRWREGH